jgi:hypothetical protein
MVLCGNNRSCNSKNTINYHNNNNCMKGSKGGVGAWGRVMEQWNAIAVIIHQWIFLNFLGSMKTCHVWEFWGRFEIKASRGFHLDLPFYFSFW